MSTEDHQTVSFYSPTELFGKGSLSPIFTKVAESVETLTLDTIIKKYALKHVDFIKIDVEGFEKPVLSGGTNLLSRADAPKILFEFSAWMESQVENCEAGDCQKYLSDLGYTLYSAGRPDTPVLMPEIFTKNSYMILAQK